MQSFNSLISALWIKNEYIASNALLMSYYSDAICVKLHIPLKKLGRSYTGFWGPESAVEMYLGQGISVGLH